MPKTMPSTASIDVRHTVAQRAAVSGVGGVLIRPNHSNLLAKKGSGTTGIYGPTNPLDLSAIRTARVLLPLMQLQQQEQKEKAAVDWVLRYYRWRCNDSCSS
jgi:hypothetical protein